MFDFKDVNVQVLKDIEIYPKGIGFGNGFFIDIITDLNEDNETYCEFVIMFKGVRVKSFESLVVAFDFVLGK